MSRRCEVSTVARRTLRVACLPAVLLLLLLVYFRWLSNRWPIDEALVANIDKLKSQYNGSSGVVVPERAITVMLLTYKRNEDLEQVLRHYCKMEKIIDRAIVVWNNVGEAVPDDLRLKNCPFPIIFEEQEVNSLHNRFIRYQDIKTDCECTYMYMYIYSIAFDWWACLLHQHTTKG